MPTKLIKAFDLYVMSPKIAIAVSGGLDSMVLMKLAYIYILEEVLMNIFYNL